MDWPESEHWRVRFGLDSTRISLLERLWQNTTSTMQSTIERRTYCVAHAPVAWESQPRFAGDNSVTNPNRKLASISAANFYINAQFFLEQRRYTSGTRRVRCSGQAMANHDLLHAHSILRARFGLNGWPRKLTMLRIEAEVLSATGKMGRMSWLKKEAGDKNDADYLCPFSLTVKLISTIGSGSVADILICTSSLLISSKYPS